MSSPDPTRGRRTTDGTGNGGSYGHPLDDSALARHRAKILRPEEAVPAWDGSPAQPTVYRYDRLLVPPALLDDREFVSFLGEALVRAQMGMEVPEQPGGRGRPRPGHPGRPGHRNRPDHRDRPGQRDGLDRAARIPVRLTHRPGTLADRPIDAWYALQVLRDAGQGLQHHAAVATISLDHILFGSVGDVAMSGGPGSEGHGWGADRTPVMLPAQPPTPTPGLAGRRPVVAVLDTGCGDHPWLDGVVTRMSPPPVGAPPAPVWEATEDGGDYVRPLLGELDSHAGHGTFIAGIIRQVAPDATVLAYPVMHSDGVVYESDVEYQLGEILERVDPINGTPKPEDFVDVVSMSFGGYFESAAAAEGSVLAARLQQLASCGVMAVASAGNDSSDVPVYPAALADASWPPGAPTVLSVGALIRRGTAAIYSNEAAWVKTWFPGSSIVSTFPPFAGSRTPGLLRPMDAVAGEVRPRAAFDPDDFSYQFAVWGGTSFAAALCSGRIASWLAAPPVAPPSPSELDKLSKPDATARASWAVAAVTDEARMETWPKQPA